MTANDFHRWIMEAVVVYAFYHLMNTLNRIATALEIVARQGKQPSGDGNG